MKILALSQDISLLNIVDYILYKDYKITKSTSFENLDVELSSFDLLIIDLPYWEKHSNIHKTLRDYKSIPLIILTEDKSSDVLANLKNSFYIRAVLKEPLSKKELKESVKELTRKKKQKKDKDKPEALSENYISSPIEDIVNNSDVVFFRITDLQEKRIEYISSNYKNVLGISENIFNLKDFAEINNEPFISRGQPHYSIIYKLKNGKIIREAGKGSFDANKYLVDIEGTITDYTYEYIQQELYKFLIIILSPDFYNADTIDFIEKIIQRFSIERPVTDIAMSIIFRNKDYFAKDFIETDYIIASDINSSERKLGEVILFSHEGRFDEFLKAFSRIIADVISIHYSSNRDAEKSISEISRLSQNLTAITNQLARSEAAFKDKAGSYDNLNELFTSAMRDFKTMSGKFNRAAIVFETNSEGKFLTANENYYRAVAMDKSILSGKYFDDIFENSSWQNFQFEFFNNSNQEITLKQKNKEGKSFYFSFHVSRENSDNGYKFIFYGKDKTEAKSLEIELNKQITEYNSKVNELIEAKKANELLWEEMNILKEELNAKDETIKKQEKKILKAQEKEQPSVIDTEYKLDKKEAEIIFQEDIKEKIEEAKEEIEHKPEDENETIFKNLRGIDVKIGLKNAYDNIDTYNEILINFENDYTDFVKDIKSKYLINDSEYIKSRLLTLSEEAKYIGAEDLEKSAQLFHDKFSDSKVTNFDFELSVLGVHLNFTLDSIRKYKDEYSLLEVQPKEETHEEENITIFAEEITNNEINNEAVNDIHQEYSIENNVQEETTDTSAFEKEIITENFVTEENIPVEEEIVEENKTLNTLVENIHLQTGQKPKAIETPFTLLIDDLKNSIEDSENSAILKEKLFKLKFENKDFGKIEKIEQLESFIESGNNSSATKILDELKS